MIAFTIIIIAGIALLQLHAAYRLHHSTPVSLKRQLETALLTVQPCLTDLNTKRMTFLCGAGGPLAVGAYLYHLLGTPDYLYLSSHLTEKWCHFYGP